MGGWVGGWVCVCVHLYFPKFNDICHLSDHFTNLSRLSCKFFLSESLLTFLNTLMASANFSTLPDISSSKSFTYVLKIV